jgi:uncharacterized protein YndB with AHSA1/START domain
MSVKPIRQSVRVKADPARAFTLFTQKMGAWWPDKKTIGPAPRADIVVEPFIGGRWFERSADGTETQWGHVLSFDPPNRIILAWQISGQWKFDPDLVTELEITFSTLGRETEVVLEHRNLERLGQDNPNLLSLMDQGWGAILGSYQRSANS